MSPELVPRYQEQQPLDEIALAQARRLQMLEGSPLTSGLGNILMAGIVIEAVATESIMVEGPAWFAGKLALDGAVTVAQTRREATQQDRLAA